MSKKKQPKSRFSLKKIFIFILSAVFLYFLIHEAADEAYNLYNKNKFRFENFKSTEEFEKVINEKFPIGSDGNRAKTILEKYGAKCVFWIDKDRFPTKQEQGWQCGYGYWKWLNYINFVVIIFTNRHHTIINVSAARYKNAF